MDHIRNLFPMTQAATKAPKLDVAFFRRRIPALTEWALTDEVIERQQLVLVEYLRQEKLCSSCRGFSSCGKEGDLQGFSQTLETYGGQVTTRLQRCGPYAEHAMRKRVARWSLVGGGLDQDVQFQFDNFPAEPRRKYPRLYQFARDFAEQYEPGKPGQGIYLFGPPGVGKTHLMLAAIHRLRDRGVPCLVIRSDSIFDRMRQIISENGDLEALLDTCATVPVLAIDEFAQERANDFTLEKLFRIINHRFHAKLPTWFTSNYAPPDIYRRGDTDVSETVSPLRSRVMNMAKMARMDGDDARQRNLESLT